MKKFPSLIRLKLRLDYTFDVLLISDFNMLSLDIPFDEFINVVAVKADVLDITVLRAYIQDLLPLIELLFILVPAAIVALPQNKSQ